MNILSHKITALALSGLILAGSSTVSAKGIAGKPLLNFGTIQLSGDKQTRAEAEAWLKKRGGGSLAADVRQRFEALWKNDKLSVLDRVTATLVLGDPKGAGQLLAGARDASQPIPTAIPALLKDPSQSGFYRSNLALAYARALSQREAHEETLMVLRAIPAQDVVDPATYLFTRGVAEFTLLMKKDAQATLGKLRSDLSDIPERFDTVAQLMLHEMETWQGKDLNWIALKMRSSGRRLKQGRGGPQTQKIQKDIVARLDEIIKLKENEHLRLAKGNLDGCPDSSIPGKRIHGAGNKPADDSHIGGITGDGKVDIKRLRKNAGFIAKMPPKERRKLLQELTKGLSDKHAQAIEAYFKKLASKDKRS